jgi:hypothetical protein
MPVSNDNQDYGEKDKQNANNKATASGDGKDKKSEDNQLTSDNLKGKKVDADLERETDKPADV